MSGAAERQWDRILRCVGRASILSRQKGGSSAERSGHPAVGPEGKRRGRSRLMVPRASAPKAGFSAEGLRRCQDGKSRSKGKPRQRETLAGRLSTGKVSFRRVSPRACPDRQAGFAVGATRRQRGGVDKGRFGAPAGPGCKPRRWPVERCVWSIRRWS